MELPRRDRGDELLKPGELTNLRKRLRALAQKHDVATVIACAFDHRTRMLPFIYADMRMVPAGVRAIGSAMVDAGFEKTRIVLQQWNPNFRPSTMKLDGRVPDVFMVSSMQIHSTRCKELIYDACGIEPAQRPLIIVGGPKTIYEPWDVFSATPDDRWGADVAVTGEEFVLLSFLERLLSIRSENESLRMTFIRARNSGILDDIQGLVYARGEHDDVAEELVDTGIQRLVGDLDELPHPVIGYRLLEPPSKSPTIGSKPLDPSRIRKYSPISSMVLTFGCKFACHYCPIPAYNQRQHRLKSPERIVDEMRRLGTEYGLKYFFGADDNFFNDHERTLEILSRMSAAKFNGKQFRKSVRWGTEVTVHDTLALKDYIPLARNAGIRALWLGVEDMTATFIKKGQNVDKTTEAFQLLQRHGINPMPMMMHHDSQPLYTPGKPYGLINQARMLRKAGAVSLQVLMLTPATGSKSYDETFTSGLVYKRVGDKRVESHMLDANYVVASDSKTPWKKQLNIMAAYLYFYNPLRFIKGLFKPVSRLYLADAGMQVIGMWGLSKTIRRTLGWAYRLRRDKDKIVRYKTPPISKLPMRSANGDRASHALPAQPAPVIRVTIGGVTAGKKA
jgi:radical SAM superfamily enzyme YgiQ (UPF0313 family)